MIEKHPIIADHYFSSVSSECQDLFKNGFYYACIALSQSVAEAIARFICERSGWNPKDDFHENIRYIMRRKIEPRVSRDLLVVWGRGSQRNDFHHLNKKVPNERKKLKTIAQEKITALNRVETKIFEYKIINGALKLKYPKYWDTSNDKASVFLRLE
jgi:hypothetical protein